ncbi:hypothetical protein AB0G05_26840 [Nonomuraea wenchangensis]
MVVKHCEIISLITRDVCEAPGATDWTAQCEHGHTVTKAACEGCAGRLNSGSIACRACHTEGHFCTMTPTE